MMTVVSGATRDTTWREIAAFTSRNHAQWAELYGGKAVMLDLDLFSTVRPPSWRKLAAIAAFSIGVNDVLWIDADCIFHPLARPQDFLAWPETFRTIRDRNGVNCGVLAFPRRQWVLKFLDDWYQKALPEEIDHPWWEQKTLHRLLATDLEVTGRLSQHLIRSSSIIHAAGVAAREKLKWLSGKST